MCKLYVPYDCSSPEPTHRSDTSQILTENDLPPFGAKYPGWFEGPADKCVQYMRLLYEDIPAEGDDQPDPPPIGKIPYTEDGWPILPETDPVTGRPIVGSEIKKKYLLAYFKALYGEPAISSPSRSTH